MTLHPWILHLFPFIPRILSFKLGFTYHHLRIYLPSSLDLPTIVSDLPTVVSDLPTVVLDLPTVGSVLPTIISDLGPGSNIDPYPEYGVYV